MDAGFVLPTPPQPIAAQVDAASDATRDDADSFAAHLPPKDDVDKPPPRRPAPKAAPVGDETVDPAAQAQPVAYSLSAPTAPAVVRVDATPGALDVAITPTPTAISPAAQTQTTPLPAPPPAQANAPTPATATPQPAQPGAAAPAAATPSTDAIAAALEQLPAAAATPTPDAALAAQPQEQTPKAAPQEPLRASSRGREGRAQIAETDGPKAAAAAQPAAAIAQAAARSGSNGDAAAPGPGRQGADARADTSASPPTALGAAPTPPEVRRAAETPLQVHRPPTVAATVAQHVIRRFDGASTTIDVRLDPAELGRVQVKLDVGPDSRVTAVVAADNPATLNDLMRSSRDLERALESAGLELASGGLSFDLSDRQSAFTPQAEAGDAGDALRGGSKDEAEIAPAPASRPFGLETWRAVRVDMTV